MFVFISCSDERYTETGIERIVSTTDSLLENLSGQKYEWASKSAYSTVMAYYPTTDIIFLNENFRSRDSAEAVNFYYYKDRALIRYISRLLEYYKNEEGKYKKRHIRLTINFDPDGDVISYDKLLNSQPENLSSEEVKKILSHSDELYRIVGDEE
jgi:hypothetical protein